ncbi:MAG TPA: ssDNA-binding protein [Ramlibacter sp.]|nr:ssDNA-binding protein [Ramlibacter sp.]
MKLKLTDVRLSFADLFEAVQFDGKGEFYFGAQLLVPEGDPQRKTIDQAIAAVAKEKWGAKAAAIQGSIEGNPQKICWIDGKKREYDGYAGNWALSTKRPQSKGRPLVLARDKSAIVAADGTVYSGCYVNASVEFWAQDNSFGKGIRCTLLGVQFNRDGDAFSAGAAASPDDFEELAAGAEADSLA